MDDDIRASWERFLDPEALKPNLILASIYIAAFDLLKDSIVERIRELYVGRFDENGKIVVPEYIDVLARDSWVFLTSDR